MWARRVAAAQRDAAQQTVAPPATAQVTWGELGCPKDTGVYRAGEDQRALEVRVRLIHIIAAEDDPQALFTVVVHRPPLGPAQFTLGHRVA